ncbi:hypothetical protein CYMTET_54259 [Cymbomonas tetramitiformis]|uniref:Uncharacterized protein n=1 Tax=Cymbomonas tetramitiformis TaxID=36881 RepID=A0AAE0EPS2_9CHLO|nr:hypothetical protein CYMTET_54259 [Cymbomonas tetramitiformis]
MSKKPYLSRPMAGFPSWWGGTGQRLAAISEAKVLYGDEGVVISLIDPGYVDRTGKLQPVWYHRAMPSNKSVADHIDYMYTTNKAECRFAEIISGHHFDGQQSDGCPYFDIDLKVDSLEMESSVYEEEKEFSVSNV